MGRRKKEERYYSNDAYDESPESAGKSRRSKENFETQEPPSDRHGKPIEYDPQFRGPVVKRGCTDVICCILFIICILGTGVVAFIAFTRGDPRRLVYPTDSEGNFCGTVTEYKNRPNVDMTERPYVFFFDLLACFTKGPQVVALGCPTPQICVKECPQDNWVFLISAAEEPINRDRARRRLQYCKYDFDPVNSSKHIEDIVLDDDCASYTVKMSALGGRCIPAIFGKAFDELDNLVKDENGGYTVIENGTSYNLTSALNRTEVQVTEGNLEKSTEVLGALLSLQDYAERILKDVQAAWFLIAIGLVLAAFVAFLWIIVMRWIAGFIIWLSVVLFISLFGFCTGFCFWKYFEIKNLPDAQGWPTAITTDFAYYFQTYNTWLAFGIIAGVIFLVVVLIILVLRTRINIAVNLVKESSKAVGMMLFTLLWPIVPFILSLAVWLYWGAQATYLASMGEAEYSRATNSNVFVDSVQKALAEFPCNETTDNAEGTVCRFLRYGETSTLMVPLQLYNLFMLFWLLCFVTALDQLVLAGAFASYYWAWKKPKDMPAFPVATSLSRALGYHLGSLAFGSLLIAIVKMIRVVLDYLDSKLKGSENPVAKFFLKCLKCCFWCLEKFLKLLNRNAYILIAVHGYSFCGAARRAFNLLMRNIVRVFVVDKVTDFVLFIGKLVIIGGVACAAFFFFDGRIPYLKTFTPSLNYFLVPVIVITLGTYVITTAFFSVYAMGVDTLFFCFLEDLERNDGSKEKPYYMKKSLQKILGKRNRTS